VRRSQRPAGLHGRTVRRLPLGSLRVFVAVAQQLNFTWAAHSLGVTASAVSLQIRALEEYLGRRLLRRDGHRVTLTDEGRELLPKVQRALDDLERALDDTRADHNTEVLRISTLASFLQRWLFVRLPQFRRRHPHIALKLHTSYDTVDFARSEHHLALRYAATGGWTGVHAEKLFDEWLVPVCTPALLRQRGPVDDVRRLARYPLLHSDSEPWGLWRDRLGGGAGVNAVTCELDDSNAVVQAALNGEGLALARWSLAGDEVRAGTLAVACSEPMPYRAYWFVRPRRVASAPNVNAFREWIFSEAAAFAPPPGAMRAD
jgi:LysR family transcriptional regulator, glycine cleavage system transcriptional activator